MRLQTKIATKKNRKCINKFILFILLILIGFGRSSRPTFSGDSMVAEKQLVRSIEEWRREMKISNMILLGHSMGGFLATSYSISYPER